MSMRMTGSSSAIRTFRGVRWLAALMDSFLNMTKTLNDRHQVLADATSGCDQATATTRALLRSTGGSFLNLDHWLIERASTDQPRTTLPAACAPCDQPPGTIISVKPAKILVVEDSAEYAQLVTAAMRKDGHEVSTASTIEAARQHLRSTPPDVVILDLTMPDGDGLDLCQEVRSSTDAFVLMLTGRDDEIDKLLGFRLGADDYMTKPFSPRELAARVAALIGRSRSRSADQPVSARVVGDVRVDIDKRSVEIAGAAVDLTKIEFELLLALSQRPGSVLSRAQLLTAVWGDNYIGDDHVVDVHIANLRKKIDIVGDGPSRVRTVRGVGYAMSV